MGRTKPLVNIDIAQLAEGVEFKHPEGHHEWYRISAIAPVDGRPGSRTRESVVVKMGGRRAGEIIRMRLYDRERGYDCHAPTVRSTSN